MGIVGNFIGKYRKLAQYRDTVAADDYMNHNVRGFFMINLIAIVALLTDAMLIRLTSDAVTPIFVPILGFVGFLTAGELMAIFALGTGQKGSVLEKMRAASLAVAVLGIIFLMYHEFRVSGSLYAYALAQLLICSLLNLRLRESLLVIVLLNLSYVVFEKFGPPAGGVISFLNPYRFMVLSSVMASLVAWRTHFDYLVNLRQRLRLEILSSTDPLTGLKNRRGMEKYVTNKNFQRRVSAVIFDVDDFKSYNDTYGHAAGDACLSMVGGLVSKLAGRFDALPVRYGGEEFVVLFFGARPDDVKDAILDTLQEMRDAGMKSGQRAVFPYVTMSAGLAITERPIGKDTERCYDLIAEADRNLYRAKTTGKNRLVD